MPLTIPTVNDLTQIGNSAWADRWGILIVSVAIVSLFVSGEVLRRRTGVATEYTRKLSHVGSGVVVITFPWLFESRWTVALLAFSFFIILLLGKVSGLLASVHDVERRTGGAFYYPFAVLGTFWLSNGDPLLYCTPLAVMALADTGAAIVGKRHGSHKYNVFDGTRSLEGSLTFFGLTFAVVLTGMALANAFSETLPLFGSGAAAWPAMLLVTLVAAILCTAVEAISVRGTDNLFITYTCFLVLDRTMRLGLTDMGGWIQGMLLSLVLVVATWRVGGLTVAGSLTVFIVGTFVWSLGGWSWVVPLLALYLVYLATAPNDGTTRLDLDEVFPTTVGALIIVLAFGHSEQDLLYLPFLATLGANGAIALTRLAQAKNWPIVPLSITGAVAPVMPVLIYAPDTPMLLIMLSSLVGLVVFVLLARTQFAGRRLIASFAAGALTWVSVML